MQKQGQFLLSSPAPLLLLLLLLLLCSLGVQCQHSSTPSPLTHPPSPSPTTTTTITPTTTNASRFHEASSEGGEGGEQSHTWNDNIARTMKNLFGLLAKNSSGENHNGSATAGAALMELLSRLPGMFQQGQGRRAGEAGSGSGNGSSEVSQTLNDVGQILASLFADPRTRGIPAWIEALLQGSTNSTRNGNSSLLTALGQQQGTGPQLLQALLSSLFQNVPQGLGSLHLTPSSSPQDILSAIISDPSLVSSLTSMGQAMLANLSSQLGLQNLLMEALKTQFPIDPSSQCGADLQTLGQGIQQGSWWALKMLDAMGKIPSGMLEGMVTMFGDYSECRSISYTDPRDNHDIEGLFCGMAIKAPDALATRGLPVIGLHHCLPSSCNEIDRYNLIQPLLKSIGSQFYGQYCYRPRDPSGDDRFTGVVIVFAVLGALCAAGTFYGVFVDQRTEKEQRYSPEPPPQPPTNTSSSPINMYTNQGYASETPIADDGLDRKGSGDGHVICALSNGDAGNKMEEKTALPSSSLSSQQPPPYTMNGSEVPLANVETSPSAVAVAQTPSKPGEGLCSKLLLSFSVLRNGRKILSCSQNSSDVSCLHGIRVLSITWVILGHCFSMLGSAQANTNATAVFLSYFTYAVFPGAFFAVDTFFLLSGCLTAFLFLKSTKKSGLTLISFVLYYVHRIWRLTPLYALVLAYYIGIFPYTKRGPFENLQGMDSESDTQCRKYWYYNLLYVNNLVKDKGPKWCLGWSWYLSNDMQFYVIAPIILIPWVLGRSYRAMQIVGHVIAVALIAVHSITTGVISHDDDLSMFKNNGKYMDKIYFVPWCRVGPYAVGLLLGFIMHQTPRSYRMPKLAAFTGWALAWIVGLTLVYVTHDNLRDLMHGTRWDTAQTAAYEALGKWVWAMCVGWVIFACYIGYGGFINTLLSWKAWMPLSRLTYGVYLVHLIVIFTLMGNHNNTIHLDAWTGTELMLAVTVLSYLISFIFCMLIEAPTLGLEKALLGKFLKKKD